MKLKNKVLLSLLLTIGILFIWNISVEAKTYETDTFAITIPDSYQTTVSTNQIETSKDNGYTAFVIQSEDKQNANMIVTEDYMNYLIAYFEEAYDGDISLLSKELIQKSGCIGLQVKFLQRETGMNYYLAIYQFLSDNYSYIGTFVSVNQSYINGTEKDQIINSLKIKDTVTTSNGIPFIDVTQNSWYYHTVKYVYEANIIKGANAYEFRPNANITRGMIVTILWRMEGSPKVTGVKDFTDVKGQYYYDAVRWAAKNGVVNGYGDGRFGPNANITREQLATILCNYSKYKKKYVSSTVNTSKYKDWYKVSSYAKSSISWAIATGVITGKDNGTRIDPLGTATRAEAAGMIYNYCTKIK